MNKVIGIISYLPEDKIIREVRIEKLNNLIISCNSLFNLPIIIVAQNWKDEIICCSNCKIYRYEKLGIAGARKELRKIFLNSGLDILIMLDDDCKIIGDINSANYYLNQIDNHNISFGEFKGTQLKLFSIHKELLKQIDFENINPELEEGFEDTIFVESLRKKFPNNRFEFDFNTSLKELSVGAGDKFSTWYTNQDLKEMLRRTQNYGK